MKSCVLILMVLGMAAVLVVFLLVRGCAPASNGKSNGPKASQANTPPPPPADLSQVPDYNQWPFSAKEARSRQEATAKALGLPVDGRLSLNEGVFIDVVLVPRGLFIMGKKGVTGNEPKETRIGRPFYIGKYEVTWRQYLAFKQKAHLTNHSHKQLVEAGVDFLDRPLDVVSWDTAVGFCKDASNALDVVMRLPTETEWEYACRAGSAEHFTLNDLQADPDAYHTQWIKDAIIKACTTVPDTKEVGQYGPNWFGIYDMIGSMSEWTLNIYERDSIVRAIRGSGGIETSPVVWRFPGHQPDPEAGLRIIIEISDGIKRLVRPSAEMQPQSGDAEQSAQPDAAVREQIGAEDAVPVTDIIAGTAEEMATKLAQAKNEY